MEIFPYIETLKVVAAWAALLYVWPGVVFRGALRGRGLTFRFLFCAVLQPLLLCLTVLLLGLLHILYAWVVRLLFWGILAVSLLGLCRRRYGPPARRAPKAPTALPKPKQIWAGYRRHLAEYIALAAILLFAAAFFLSGAFHDYSFGFYDQYTHYQWTDALINGNVFSAGVYPQGMHCFLYAMQVLFGVRLYSGMVFLGGWHNAVMFLLAAYCLLKELLHSRWAVLFVLSAWAVFNGIGPAALSSMARMSWTLPEEFALYLVFLCPLALLRYLRGQGAAAKWYRDCDLLFLAAGVALAVSTHFYVLAMAFLPCCAVILAHCLALRPLRRLPAAVGAAVGGLGVGLLPMLAAYAMGTPLEGSLRWGVRTAAGETIESAVVFAAGPAAAGPAAAGAVAPTAGPAQAPSATLTRMATALYQDGWAALFGHAAAVLLLLASVLVLALAIAGACTRRQKRPQKAALPAAAADGYLVLTASLAAFVLLYALPYMGLPELVRNIRTLCVTQLLAFAVAGILADVLLLFAQRALGRPLPGGWMALGCVLLYAAAYLGDFHQTTYWWLFRYNASVTVTDQIMDAYPKDSYTIVSLWDEAHQADAANWQPLLGFMQNVETGGGSISTEYIFLYVEKNPIWWGQVHLTAAPGWLARDNAEMDWSAWSPSRCPEIWCVEVSPRLAARTIDYSAVPANYYSDMETRMVLFAKAYAWYQAFSAAHPADTWVYYEDDDFACYVIQQDPAAPLALTAAAAK